MRDSRKPGDMLASQKPSKEVQEERYHLPAWLQL